MFNKWRLANAGYLQFKAGIDMCPWESQQVNVESQRATGTVRRSMELGPRYLFRGALLTVLRVVYAGTQKGHSRARKAILVLARRS